MYGLDIISRIQGEEEVMRQVRLIFNPETERSVEMASLITECQKRNLPLNEGKAVLQQSCSSVLGGGLDGLLGVLMHARDKNFKFSSRTLALLSLPEVPQVALQHWSGLFCFMASSRRPMFSIVHEFFPFISCFADDQILKLPMPQDVRDEILVAALLSPLSFSNLRAQIRSSISISDASEDGGSAGEASKFVDAIDRKAGQVGEDCALNHLEESYDSSPFLPLSCSICKL